MVFTLFIWGFPTKKLLIYCCLVGFIVLAILFVEPILAYKEGKVIFLNHSCLIVFPNKVVSELGRLSFFFFFFGVKMDDGMMKLNSLNYSTRKRMMEDCLYCKDLYKPIRLKNKPFQTLDDD